MSRAPIEDQPGSAKQPRRWRHNAAARAPAELPSLCASLSTSAGDSDALENDEPRLRRLVTCSGKPPGSGAVPIHKEHDTAESTKADAARPHCAAEELRDGVASDDAGEQRPCCRLEAPAAGCAAAQGAVAGSPERQGSKHSRLGSKVSRQSSKLSPAAPIGMFENMHVFVELHQFNRDHWQETRRWNHGLEEKLRRHLGPQRPETPKRERHGRSSRQPPESPASMLDRPQSPARSLLSDNSTSSPDHSEGQLPWKRPRLPSVSLLGLNAFRDALDPALILLDLAMEACCDAPCQYVAEKMLEHLLAKGRVIRGKEQLAQTSFVGKLSSIEDTAVVACAHNAKARIGSEGKMYSPREGLEGSSSRCLAELDPLKPEAEEDVVHILVDSAEWLESDVVCLARFPSYIRTGLEEDMGEKLKVSSRFLLICLSSESAARSSQWVEARADGKLRHVEMGEAAATMFQDERVVRVAYSATRTEEVVAAFDLCLRNLKVVPQARLPDEEAILRRARQMVKQTTEVCSGKFVNQRERWVRAQQDAFGEGCSVSVLLSFMQTFAVPLLSGIALALVLANLHAEFYDRWAGHGPMLVDGEAHRRLGGGEDARPDIFGWKINGHAVTLHFVVNDVLMCLFFGLAGKEITEALQPGGSLYPPTRSTLNVLAATAGGVVGPIVVYLLLVVLCYSSGLLDDSLSLDEYTVGWGVPTATDISLAWVTAICVFGAGHPAVNYLLLLAIIDDGIGLMIIAFAYPDPSNPLRPQFLLLVLAAMAVSYVLRRLKCTRWQLYVGLAGPLSWAGLLHSGLHPALALVFVVPFIPLRVENNILTLQPATAASNGESHGVSRKIANHPLHEYEESVKNFIDFFVLFMFGTVNAGVRVDGAGWLTVIVLLSLVVGKVLGIFLTSQVATRCGCPPPAGMTRASVASVGFIASTGLTVALFVSGEAFADAPELAAQSKMGALLSAVVAFVAIAASLAQAKLAKEAKRRHDPELGEAPGDISSPPRRASMDTALEDMVVNHAVRSLNLVHDATDAVENRVGLPRSRTLELLKASMQLTEEEEAAQEEETRQAHFRAV